jgi:hypothetical protein
MEKKKITILELEKSLNQLKYRFEPKFENGNKTKAFQPTIKDITAFNNIVEYINQINTNPFEFKDIVTQKLYLILFSLTNREFLDPEWAQKYILEKLKLPISFFIRQIAQDIQTQNYIQFAKEKNLKNEWDIVDGQNYYSLTAEQQKAFREHNAEVVKEISIEEFEKISKIDTEFVTEKISKNYYTICNYSKNFKI